MFFSIRRDQLPKDTLTIHAFAVATHESLSPRENVLAVTFMENELVRLGKQEKCYGILTSNMSPLTQQLASDVLGYETISDHQLNQFINADGVKPFENAPDSCWTSVQ